METYDFSGWVTRNDIRCSDGRTIRRGAFKECDGKSVPLVWNHSHNDVADVLGHIILHNHEEGVRGDGKFNDTEAGRTAKALVHNGDITSLSIYANQLKQVGSDVMHGNIREVSLVLAGANPGAFIDTIISHSDDGDEEARIYFGEENSVIELAHEDEPVPEEPAETPVQELEHKDNSEEESKPMADNKEKTVGDVLDTLNEEQRNVVMALIAQALEDASDNDSDKEEGESNVKHNVFENDENEGQVLSHSDIEAAIGDWKRYGSLKDAFLEHGITNIDYLFPEAKTLNNTPDFITREMEWVSKFMDRTHKSPFARIKSVHANITADEARAKGFFGGEDQINPETGKPYRNSLGLMVDKDGNRVMKQEEVFSLLKRTTTPTTVYKKQSFDRDDIIDITDLDVVAWVKGEMRVMLNEEIARACLVGDGRLASSDDKINEANIRPIWTDADLYTVKCPITYDATDEDANALAFIKAVIKSRKNYKGSGNPVLYMTEDLLTQCLLLTDNIGRDLYDTVEKLRTKLRVADIVTVPVMDNLTRTVAGQGGSSTTYQLAAILVNPSDYNVGADKGGQVTMFDDFDIDYNQQKYLIETRISGALTKPYSAIAYEFDVTE